MLRKRENNSWLKKKNKERMRNKNTTWFWENLLYTAADVTHFSPEIIKVSSDLDLVSPLICVRVHVARRHSYTNLSLLQLFEPLDRSAACGIPDGPPRHGAQPG